MGYAAFRLQREALARLSPSPAPVERDPFAELQAAYDAVRAENDALRTKLAETEALLATATAPPPPAPAPAPMPPPPAAAEPQERRARR